MSNKLVADVDEKVLAWLLRGDVALQYQVHRDLLHSDNYMLRDLQSRIKKEGWGAEFLAHRRPDGHWGKGLYQPKWTSTHYTLLDLRNICYPPGDPRIDESLDLVLQAPQGADGGLNLAKTVPKSDICVNGMILNYATWFRAEDRRLNVLVEYLLEHQMRDGGWNCEYVKGATHSSLHSTISVLEGLWERSTTGSAAFSNEIANAIQEGEQFILRHHLYRSHTTDNIIDQRMLRLTYPSRWRFDILRGLDYFSRAGTAYDSRMQDALEHLAGKRLPDGRWPLQANHKGAVHFKMETPGEPSRWNTLRALRVLNHFNNKKQVS